MLKILFACALAVTVAAPVAYAQQNPAPVKVAAKSMAGLKTCRTKAPTGKLVTWKCKTEQPCCMNATTGQGVCGSQMLGCL